MVTHELEKFDENIIRDRIYSIRGFQVMLDSDLAELYEVKTKRLNEAVKRNKERFPDEFCFQIDEKEVNSLRCQFVTMETANSLRSQFATLKNERGKHRKYFPYVFTQEGVAMLSAVLKSSIAVEISIRIMKAFIEMRKFNHVNAQIFQRFDNFETRLLAHDQKFDKVFDALENKRFIPEQGIFYENQVFDAYKFVSDLFRSSKKSILIIDNYIDDSVLVHLTAIDKGVKVKILTKSISDKLALDILKFSSQYFPIEANVFSLAHDRFIIIDDKDVSLRGFFERLGKEMVRIL